MAFQDSDPERRNLMITSLAFITYFFAGGEFVDTNVRLQVVNVHFTRPEVLALIAWMTLVWFLYRYWLKHSGAFGREFESEFNKLYKKPYISKYLCNKINKPIVEDEDEGYILLGIRRNGVQLFIKYVYARNIKRDVLTKEIQTFFLSNDEEEREKELSVNGFYGFFLKLRLVTLCFFKYPSFSSYLVPYILFLLVIVGAITKL